MITIQVPILTSKVAKVFESVGHTLEEAQWAAEALVAADLWGVSTHGVQRLPHYVKRYTDGTIKPNVTPKITTQTPSTATLDGQGGSGFIIARKAMQIAIDKAQQCGTGWVAVKNSSHFGCGGFYTQLALQKEMIGIALTNASPIVAPKGSSERVFGTNPIAAAFPTPGDLPFSFDFSTSMTTCGFLEAHSKCKIQLPIGVVIDASGAPTTNIHALDNRGCILPMGYNTEFDNSHKGYALGSMVDLFCGVVSGASFGKWVPTFTISNAPPLPSVGNGTGHFFGALSIEAFRPKHEYYTDMATWLDMVKQAKPIAGSEVLLPGEKEVRKQKIHERQGLLIPQKTLDFIESFCK